MHSLGLVPPSLHNQNSAGACIYSFPGKLACYSSGEREFDLSRNRMLTNGGSLRSDKPSTSLLISMRMSRSAGLLTSTSVWVCWPL